MASLRESSDPSVSFVRSSEAPAGQSPTSRSSANQGPTDRSPSAQTQAEKLHEILLLAQATSNLGRRKFISTLLALHELRLHFQLGSPSVDHYARTHFGIERSITFEYLRVAKALRELPHCDEEFRIGRLNWSALREITKVATSESEEEWIAFALKYPGARLKAEVKEAVRKNRSKPRKDGYSLPGLETRLVFELKPEEQDLASKALEEVAREMSERLQGAEIESKDAFLFLARRFLEDRVDEDARAGDPVDPEQSLYTILYHKCPDCRRASLPTSEGPVEIDAKVVEWVEGDARKVVIEDHEERTGGGGGSAEGGDGEEDQRREIDRPNPRGLVRKIHLRDGRTCSNPGCERRIGLHAHHIVERAHGGATAVYNEILVCNCCHALLHAGQLTVQGSPLEGVAWTVSAGERSADLWSKLKELNSVPTVFPEGRVVTSDATSTVATSTAVDPKVTVDPEVKSSTRFRDLVEALRTLGFSAAQAKRRLERVWESFGARVSETSDEQIVKSALRVRAA